MGTYQQWTAVDNFVYFSGKGPRSANGDVRQGRLGRNTTVEEGYADARLAGLNLLAVARSALGELSEVTRVVKLLGMVNASSDFGKHTAVVNGCSDLFIEVFGPEIGHHARSAVGVNSLPDGMTVEIEAIFQVKPGAVERARSGGQIA